MATDIYKVLARCIRVGRVSSVDTANASARVTFPDHDDIVSAPLKVLMRGCKSAKDLPLMTRCFAFSSPTAAARAAAPGMSWGRFTALSIHRRAAGPVC